jgi:hypothetical protein
MPWKAEAQLHQPRDLGTRWWQDVSFALRPHYSLRNSPWYPLDRSLDEYKSQSRDCTEVKTNPSHSVLHYTKWANPVSLQLILLQKLINKHLKTDINKQLATSCTCQHSIEIWYARHSNSSNDWLCIKIITAIFIDTSMTLYIFVRWYLFNCVPFKLLGQ